MASTRSLPVLGAYAHPKQPSGYKPSLYNVTVEKGDVVYMFNSRSTALSELTKEHYQLARQILDGRVGRSAGEQVEQLRQGLIAGQFLIPDDFDEIQMLKVKNRLTRFGAGGLGLIIAPTLRCNFGCEYCYVDLNANKMPRETREKVKKFFDAKLLEDSSAGVTWTGGDPSLAMDVVEDLSLHFLSCCERKKSSYNAGLITNGYLLNGRMRSAVKNSQITMLQISLDGAKEFHDKSRYLVGGKPTYDTIMANVEDTCEEVQILLRINVDNLNHSSIPTLLDDICQRRLQKKVQIYFAHVDDVNRNSAEYKDRVLTAREYAKIEVGLTKLAYDLGFKVGGRTLTVSVGEFCGANSSNYFVIDSSANLLKCYHDLGSADTEGIGHIDENGKEVVTHPQNLFKWLGWDPFEIEECSTCKVLPLCMGGCSHKIMNHGMKIELGCLKLRFTIDEMVELYADHLKQRGVGKEVITSGCSGCAVTDMANV